MSSLCGVCLYVTVCERVLYKTLHMDMKYRQEGETRVREVEGQRVGSLELHLRDRRDWQEIVTSKPEYFGFFCFWTRGCMRQKRLSAKAPSCWPITHPTATPPPPIICFRQSMTIDAISHPQNRDAKLLHQ